MTGLYFNIVKVSRNKDHTFAIYVSENKDKIVQGEKNKFNKAWSKIKEQLGDQDEDCQWHRCIINTKKIIGALESLGCKRSYGLCLEGDKTIKF